jgi:alkaline phosphatase D
MLGAGGVVLAGCAPALIAPRPLRTPHPLDDMRRSDAFPLGVASGDATDGSIVLWTHYRGQAPLTLLVWRLDDMRVVRRIGVRPREGGFVHADVSRLASGARYGYTFLEDGSMRAPIGRFRAPIDRDALEPLRFGAVSCTQNNFPKYVLEHAGARDDLDLFLLLGDTTYNDHIDSLGHFRDRWAESLGSTGWRAARRATSLLATWDDHEVANNFDPESPDVEPARRAFFDNLPLRRDTDDPDRIYKRVRWGRTAEIFVLDTRGERRPSTRGGEDVYVSRAQMEWLKRGLEESDAVFKLILNSVPISDFPGAFAISDRDRWHGYPRQREEILTHIDEREIRGVLWISGDFHLASSQRICEAGPGAGQREILVGPGAQIPNPLAQFVVGPCFDMVAAENNYAIIDLDPIVRRAGIRWLGVEGHAFAQRSYDF